MFKTICAFISIFLGTATAHAEKVSIETIAEMIADNNITSADDLLSQLPKDYRKSFTLMFDSHGANGSDATFALPRIIFYGDDASLLIAAYGNPSLPSYERLEMIQARADRFDLYTVDFGSKAPTKGNIVPRNRSTDRACTRCHHTDPRPNWEHYREWPGAYAGDGERLGWQDGEYDGWKEFQKTRENPKNFPRYQFLEEFDLSYFEDPDFGTTWFHHNGKLTDRLAPHNAKRIARLIRAIPDFAKHEATVRSILAQSNPLNTQELDASFRNLGLGGFVLSDRRNYEMEALEKYVRAVGVDTSGWALNFHDEGHSYRTSEDGAFSGYLLDALRLR